MDLVNNDELTIKSLKRLFNLEATPTQEFFIKPTQNITNEYEVNIKLKRTNHICPSCGYTTNIICDYRNRLLKAPKIFKNTISIKYKQRRYFCPNCKKRFIESNNIVQKHSKISNLGIDCITKSFKETMSLTAIAKENNVSVVSIINVLQKIKIKNTSLLPTILSMDEFKFSGVTPKYAVSLYDLDNKCLNNTVKDRRYNSIISYLSKYEKKEREKVRLVIIDQWRTYANIVKYLFPNAIIIADKFHYVRHINWALRDVRIRIMNSNKETILYKALKKNWKIVQSNPANIKGNCFNQFTKEITTKEQFIQDCVAHNKEIAEAISLYHYFLNESSKIKSFSEACIFINNWLFKLDNTNLAEFNELKTLFKNWKNEIINSLYIKNKNNKSYTNGAIEGFNNKIKTLNRVGYGYTNFERFNTRLSLLA